MNKFNTSSSNPRMVLTKEITPTTNVMANMKERSDDAILPASLRSDARENERRSSITNLRKDRDAELAALRTSSVSEMQDKVFGSATKSNGPMTPEQHSFSEARSPDDRRSKFSEMREKVARKSDLGSPITLEGFYQSQSARKLRDNKNKEQATQLLQSFKGVKDDKEYRAYIFAVHPDLGIIMLHASKERKRGAEIELPGDYILGDDFKKAAQYCDDDQRKELLAAGKIAAARTLLENIGLDMRHSLSRFQPAILRSNTADAEEHQCQHRKRLYFFISLSNDDYFTRKKLAAAKLERKGYSAPLSDYGRDYLLKLSSEYSGYTYEKDIKVVTNLLSKHSNGASKEALILITKRLKNRDVELKPFLEQLEEENSLNDDVYIDFTTKEEPEEEEEEEEKEEEDIEERVVELTPMKKKGLFSCLSCWGSDDTAEKN
mmetsp:Transcript_2270/g.2923  ORF Transcript_2270/g.2923 Transcript_2270/m.2923 type:complete len:434 (+) Transcript_2270:2-1303(+)